MPIKFYNTLTHEKENFIPVTEGKAGIYVCGVTPYDHSHIGHARVYVAFDILFKLFRHEYGNENVTYVRNFTDIDDKIINRANENGEKPQILSERFIESYKQDMAKLNTLVPTEEPKVTTHIAEIIELVETLVEKGFAYVTEAGDVNYDISKKEDYGKLSRRKLEDLLAGARVDVDENKRNAGDFALWKAAKEGEPSWESPWGAGRPGWHIECSAMSLKYLGELFDIHGGGEDLQFPHHENEIAQSEGACGHKHVNVWMHNAFITVEGRKMSKSLGNFTTIKDALKKYSGEAIRLWLLQTHYRKPVDYSEAALEAAETRLRGLYQKLALMEEVPEAVIEGKALEALRDDLNTSVVLAEMENNLGLAKFMGFLQMNPDDYLKGRWKQEVLALSDDEIQAKIEARKNARANKNWVESDRIRDELVAQGIILEDNDGETIWRRK